MIVPVVVDQRTWWKLTGMAEVEGLKVADLLRRAAYDLTEGERVGAYKWTGAHERAVQLMVAGNWTDREIGLALGFSRTAVSDRRRLLGLQRDRVGRPSQIEVERKASA